MRWITGKVAIWVATFAAKINTLLPLLWAEVEIAKAWKLQSSRRKLNLQMQFKSFCCSYLCCAKQQFCFIQPNHEKPWKKVWYLANINHGRRQLSLLVLWRYGQHNGTRKGVMHFCCMTGEWGSKEALPFPNQDLLGEKEGIWSNQKFVVAIASLEVDLGYHRESGVSSLTTHTI